MKTPENKPLTKVQSIKLIEDLFRAIPDAWAGFKLMRDDLFELNSKAEKLHRKGAYSNKYNLSIANTSKYFTVMHLFDGMQAATGETKGYTIEAILHIRFECLKAQAYAMTNKEKLQAWYLLAQASRFNELDYCELIK